MKIALDPLLFILETLFSFDQVIGARVLLNPIGGPLLVESRRIRQEEGLKILLIAIHAAHP